MRNPTKRRPGLLILLLFCLLLLKLNSDWSHAAGSAPKGRREIAHTLTGDIRVHKNFHSQFLPTDRDLVVYLPPGYDRQTAQRYPVLYMQDGQNLFDAATCFSPGVERHFDERAQALITERSIRPLIIVGIYSTELHRINEYTPTRAPGVNRGGEADLYGRMLVEEIKPFIDRAYRTLSSSANTGLGGASLGGLVTVYLGLKYAHTFGKLAVTSPASYWDNEMIVRYVQALSRKSHQRIFLSVGTGEPDLFVSSTRDLHHALTVKVWKEGVDLSYAEPLVFEHRSGAWTPGVDLQLKFLFSAKAAGRAR
jgi:predicted alpha/beta superfamily hydrolase